jgi:hypothetical protein
MPCYALPLADLTNNLVETAGEIGVVGDRVDAVFVPSPTSRKWVRFVCARQSLGKEDA